MLSVPCITLSKQLVNSERRTADLSFLRNSKFGYADRSKTPNDTSSSSSLVLTSCLILPATSSRVLLFFSARTLNGIIYSQIEYRMRFFLSIEINCLVVRFIWLDMLSKLALLCTKTACGRSSLKACTSLS